ncbi:CinA family nicotinamide mononucleotide deamidase-related protein [Geomesophilobacter sediminis]|uniref:CinA-like protein n=1 Tax=Geomesophilobacter sediminis TaxID=2798584 RepID=A0A8J7LVJ9_9BACT|nr:CinA family nicotinamide mononucleotide deamidase-related protein [Geomesophilobacter sediminis]MBJ6725609.1 CinA family nicotinamide mononucleotide deamidase-related protein [Geomesophilobacter sediminis]
MTATLPNLAVLSIGNELLCGEIVDTNAAHIEARLFARGFRVRETKSVPDERAAIAEALLFLARRNAAVIVTGGLGPTEDDLTAAAAADAAGTTLASRPEALAHLQAFARRMNRQLHAENERQTFLPQTARLLDNPLGTALGFAVAIEAATAYFMPGVPYEMERILEDSVIPALIEAFGDPGALPRRVLKLFGLPEAEAGALIKGIQLPPGVELAYCFKFPEVHIILRGVPESSAAVDAAQALVRERVGEYLIAEDEDTIDEVLARLFLETGATLSLAESCTGGLIAARITARAGSSAYFLEGAVTYSNAAKSRLLRVPAELIEAKGAVSAEVARAMAQGARLNSGSTLALSVTGIAGPDGGTPEKPVGTVYIALADAADCEARGYLFPGDRERVRVFTTYTALNLLRRRLLTLKG